MDPIRELVTLSMGDFPRRFPYDRGGHAMVPLARAIATDRPS